MLSGARPPRGGPACSATPRQCGGSPRSSPTSTACDRSRPSRFASRRGATWIPSATGGWRSSRRLDEAHRPVARIGSPRAWPRGRRRRRPGAAGHATRARERDDGARAREPCGPSGRRVAPGAGRLALREETTAGITNFLHRAMLRGTAKRTAEQFATSYEDIGGTLDAGGEVEAAEVRGQTLARNWTTLLALIAEAALEPALEPEEIERERRLLLAQIKSRADAPFSFTFDAVLRDLYGPHPYGRHYLGHKESIERLTRDELRAHYRAIYRPERMVLAVSGQVERGRVIKVAERLFGRMARTI